MSLGLGFLESTAEEKDLGAVTYFGGDLWRERMGGTRREGRKANLRGY